MSTEVSVGALVINPLKPEWGPGKVVKLEPQRVYVVWRDAPDSQPKAMIPSALVLASVQNDPVLDSLSEAKGNRKARTKNLVAFNQAKSPISVRDFVGFSEADFVELAGSTWRGRHTLGGLLAKTLRGSLKRPYKSWGVRRRLELHIAEENHYSAADPLPFPKLFVYSKDRLAFGFYIEAPLNPADQDAANYIYWRALRKRLKEDSSVAAALIHAMDKHQLTLADYYRRDQGVFRGSFKVRDGAITFESSITRNVDDMQKDEFIHRITEPDTLEWMDLHVFTELDKATAFELKGDVATPILSVLNDLVPLYEYSIGLESDDLLNSRLLRP